MNIRQAVYALSFGAIFVGCIDEPPSSVDCTSGRDCPLARQVCDLSVNQCVFFLTSGPGCLDADEDGYGINEDRTECQFAEEDTDDTDADIYPGADDLCDGKDNDSDGELDEVVECTSIADCPRSNLPEAAFFRCIEGTCVLKPSMTSTSECDVELSCVDGAYEDVPETCM